MNRLRIAFAALPLTVLLLSHTGTAFSKDISNEQRNAYEAREQYNKRKSELAALTQRVAQQEARLAQEQKRLDKLKADQAAAQTAMEQAKGNLDQRVQELNDVWDQRTR